MLDRVPARRVIVPCIAIFGCTFASLSLLTNHLWHLYAAFIVLGIVGNGTAHLAFSRALSTWFHERRGLAFALLMSGGALGAMILPVIAQSLIDSVGWRSAYVLLGLMVLVIGLPLGMLVRARQSAAGKADDFKIGFSVSQGLRSWMFWIIVAVLFACSLSQNGAITHMAALLTDRGMSAASAATALSILGGATLVGRLLTGWLLDRYFAPRVSLCLLAIASLGVFVLANAQSPAVSFFGAACIGLGMGGEADVTPYLLAKYFGLRSFSTLYGLTWTAYAIAGAIGPVIMGKAFDVSGSYQALLINLSVFTLVSAGLMMFLPRYHRGASENLLLPGDLSAAAVSD